MELRVGWFLKKIINTTKAPTAIGPYSQAVKCNGFLFISGQLPVEPTSGQFEGTDIVAQTRQSLENIKAILSEAGATMHDVIKTTVFIKNMDDFAAMNEIYANYFSDSFPARACVEVSRLPKDALVEVEAIATYR